ncbi:hypothetical protein [Flavobacterium sp.]|uniref:hypothetical protein n=1 Tax=Flavobacterium sp. TaxID=239 RepID=UPI002FD9D15B
MIEVFKTNVQKVKQVASLTAILSDKFANFSIHFDLEDCDKILRVEGTSIPSEMIIELLNSNGFQCEILM